MAAAALADWARRRRKVAAAAAAKAAQVSQQQAAATNGCLPEYPTSISATSRSSSATSHSSSAASAAGGAPAPDLPSAPLPATPDQRPGAPGAAPAPPPPPQHRPAAATQLPDGEHHVRYGDGSAYYGEWRGGRMHGRGAFLWPSGDRYEGEWSEGLQSGTGTCVLADGATYFGSWLGGAMHGECVFRPAPPDGTGDEVLYLQRYDHGRLASQQVLRVAETDVRKASQRAGRKQAKREAKQARKAGAAAYQAPKPGEPVYRGHRSYDLMRQLQLGITFSTAQADGAAAAELREADFYAETTQHFPAGAETSSFRWKDYAPCVFRCLRAAFGIDDVDYLLSLTGDASLRLLGSPGKSGSVFFLSDDDRFLVKTVGKEEMRLLLKLIPRYYRHVRDNPATLLVRFYGVHRVTPLLGRRVRFVVMGNVLPSHLRLHRKFDLKGSTFGRTVGEEARRASPHATLKDLDVDVQLVLPARLHEAALAQARRDLRLLEELAVIDYSLLLGVHFTRWGNDAWYPPFATWPEEPQEGAAAAAAAADGEGAGARRASGEGPGSGVSSAPGTPLSAAGLAGACAAAVAAAAAQQQQQLEQQQPEQQQQPTRQQQEPGGPQPTLGRLHSSFQRQPSSIADANALAALIESLAQQAADAAQAGDDPLEGPPLGAGAAARRSSDELPASLRQAAARLVQLANCSRAQARQSARAALQAAEGAAAQEPAALPDPAGEALQRATLEAAQQVLGLQQAQQRTGQLGSAPAVASTLPAVAAADQPEPGHWWLDRSCGLGGAVCLSGAGGALDGCERWVCSPPPPQQPQQPPQQPQPQQPQPPQPPHPAGKEPDEPSVVLSATGAVLGGARSLAAAAAAALLRQQSVRLDRLLSRRVGAQHDSVGRAVPAVAVRRVGGCTGEVQCEPVLLYFGIIDFLQDYSARKHVERWYKAAVHGGERVSVADPRRYSRRFLRAVQSVMAAPGGGGGGGGEEEGAALAAAEAAAAMRARGAA